MTKLFAGILLLTGLLTSSALAWSGGGHMLIAAEAYRSLTPEFKAQTFDTLKAHPDFVKWTNAYQTSDNMDLPAYVFMRCSTWPDEIRRKGNEWDHPNWHYMNYPLRPPQFPFEAAPDPDNNVLSAIAECEKTLSDTNASPEKRAVHLSWLVHLVGDVHQPLHCTAYFSDDFPKGDKGGNDFYVMPGTSGTKLHRIWDGLLGVSPAPRTEWNYAILLESKLPKDSLSELVTNITPQSWSLECRQLSIEQVYLNGALKGSVSADTAPALPPDYTKTAKVVAERQGMLAGHRLATEIQTHLKLGLSASPKAESHAKESDAEK